MTASFTDLAHKVASGQALTPDDARRLAETTDLVTVGMVATEARRAHVGDGVTYVRVAEHAFDAAAPEGGWPASAHEIRLTGTPASAEDAIAAAHRVTAAVGVDDVAIAAPPPFAPGTAAAATMNGHRKAPPAKADARPQVTAFALADLWALAGRQKAGLDALARALRDAGVCAVAEVTIDTLPDAELRLALDIVLRAGLLAPVASWKAAPADPVAAFAALRTLQSEVIAFRAVAPLPRLRPAPTDTPTTGYDDVKLVALARVMLDNIQHVQVDWVEHGPKLAQVALLFGASDLDRVSPADDSPLGHRRAPLEEVQRNITAAFLKPIERNAKFEQVER